MALLQYVALIMQRGFRARDKSGAVWLGCNHQRAWGKLQKQFREASETGPGRGWYFQEVGLRWLVDQGLGLAWCAYVPLKQSFCQQSQDHLGTKHTSEAQWAATQIGVGEREAGNASRTYAWNSAGSQNCDRAGESCLLVLHLKTTSRHYLLSSNLTMIFMRREVM